MKISKALALMFVIILGLSFIVGITASLAGDNKMETKIVDCYDKESNKIIGVDCEDTVLVLEYKEIATWCVLIAVFCAVGLGITLGGDW